MTCNFDFEAFQKEKDDPYVISLNTDNKKLQNSTGQVRAPGVKIQHISNSLMITYI